MKINEEIYYLSKYALTEPAFHGAIKPLHLIRENISEKTPHISFSEIEKTFSELTKKPLNDYNFCFHYFSLISLKNKHKEFFQSLITLRKVHCFLYKIIFKYGFYSKPETQKGFNGVNALTFQDIVYFQKKKILYLACGENKLDILTSLFTRERFKECSYLWNKAKFVLDKEETLNMLIIFAKASNFDNPVKIWQRFEEQTTDNFKKDIINALININDSDIQRVFNKNYISEDLFSLLNTQSYGNKVVLDDIYQFLNMSSTYFQNKELSHSITINSIHSIKKRERL